LLVLISNNLLLVKLFKNQKNQLVAVEKDSFKLEREIQELVEKNLETLFNLEFVSTEFSVGEFRIDTLAFDESTNAFVIVEYKRGSNYSVVDQGYSYLSTLLNNKAEFVLEYNEKTGNTLKRDSVDWSSSRVIFIAPTFNSYQKNSVNFSDVPFELWELRRFENGLISIEQIEATSNVSIDKISSKSGRSSVKSVRNEVKATTVTDHENKMDDSQKKLWQPLKDRLEQLDGSFNAQKNYICLKKESTGVCYVGFKKKEITIEILRGNEKPDGSKSKGFFTLDDPKKLATTRSWAWKSGVKGNIYVIKFRKIEQLDYIIFLIEQKLSKL